nr:hypothetical protein CFP56_45141 [Quercus suber]
MRNPKVMGRQDWGLDCQPGSDGPWGRSSLWHQFKCKTDDQTTKVRRVRKHASDVQSSSKGGSGSFTRPETHEVIADAPCHGVRKGLMASQGLVTPPPLPLLVKDKEYAVDTVRSIVRDVNLDECSKNETNPLGDFGLHGMMRVLIKCLKDHLESEANDLKKFKESSRNLGQEVIDLKAKLSRMTHQFNKLAKENSYLKFEMAVLHEHMDKVKEEAIEEYQMPQPYFNQNGGYYGDGFKDFHKQVVLMFLNLDISQIHFKLTTR